MRLGNVIDPDSLCAAKAAGQQGVIHRDQAIAVGMNGRTIAARVRSGRWRTLFPSTYLVGGAPNTAEARFVAAILWSEKGFLSHRTAGLVWELDGVQAQETVEISAYKGAKVPGLTVHRLRSSDKPALRVIRGLVVTGPERTLLDLAGVLPMRSTGRAVDDALRRKLTNLDRLWGGWERDGGRGRKGTAALRDLLAARDTRDGVLASRLEAKMLTILRRLPAYRAVPDFRVAVGGHRYRLDFAYPEFGLGIETQGIRWHLGDERYKRDLVRDRRLQGAGWTVLYFSWDDVHLRPRAVEEEIRTFLEKRSMLPFSREVGGG